MSTYDYNSYNTYSSYDSGAAGAVVGGVFLIIGIVILIALVLALCAVIGEWKAFKKAGKGGWEAIIPVYNQVTLCKIVGVNPWWILIIFLGSMVLGFIPVIGSLASTALTIYFLVLLNVSTARSFGKSDSFAAGLIFLAPFFWLSLGGKNTQYVGATPMNDVVMNFVNEKILKKGPQNTANNNMNMGMPNGVYPNQTPMNNMNMGMPNGAYPNQAPMNNMNPGVVPQQPMNAPVNPQVQSTAKFCTGCGFKIENGERFCPGCGKEVQ